MNSAIYDPDTKVNMSLDEIIRLSRDEVKGSLRRKRMKKRKPESSKAGGNDHSVPLLTSSEGVSIVVSKKSPLLAPEIKKSFLMAVKNRSLNADLLKKSSRVIPAKYKLIKTNNGLERVLVPVNDYICRPLRKLHHSTPRNQSFNRKRNVNDEMPPLVSVPLSKPVHSPYDHLKQKAQSSVGMEVDGHDDDDVVVINPTIVKKEPELIDVEMNVPIMQSKEDSDKGKTLNDRFSRLTGTFQF